MSLSSAGLFWQAGHRKFMGVRMQSLAGQGDRSGRSRLLLRLSSLLALIPFLLLSLMMSGTMLARDGQGGVTVVLCAGDGGTVEMVMGADGRLTEKAPHDDHADSHSVCHWAPHGQPLLEIASPDLAAPLPVPAMLAFAGDLPAHLRRADVLVPSARGPPAFV